MLNSRSESPAPRRGLVLAALGVVFGDIGTSPLYALRECFGEAHGVAIAPATVMGLASLVFWVLMLVVCLKYVALVMRFDNNGEGGILALMALADRTQSKRRMSAVIVTLGILGAALLFGDAIITPAISVLSAVEGLTVAWPAVQPCVLPCTVAVLLALFLIQRRGTQHIGTLFGPVLLLWFFVIGVLGFASVVRYPAVLAAVNPWYAAKFLATSGFRGFVLMGTVFLTVTGAEVLYADMGHFGRSPIRRAWLLIVMPMLLLNYFGQAAYLLRTNALPEHLFFNLCPAPLIWPMVILATVATVIASQAVISGTFSLARQAVQLDLWPRLKIVHTSHHAIGQVFVPFANAVVCAGTIALVLGFRHSSNLASAYGIAVSGTMLITTVLALVVARGAWKAPGLLVAVGGALFLLIDLSFFSANMVKLASGGWIVVFTSALVFLLVTTWRRGRKIMRARARQGALDISLLVTDVGLHPPVRVPGTAVFFTSNKRAVPEALLQNIKHNKLLHQHTIILTVVNEEIPVVPENERATCTPLEHGLFCIVVRCGFCESPHIPKILRSLELPGVDLRDETHVSFFLGKQSIVIMPMRTMAPWRKMIFRYLAHNAATAASFFHLPPNRVVELGMQVTI